MGFFDTLSRSATSEKAGDEEGPPRRRSRTSSNVRVTSPETASRGHIPSRSTNVAGRSRRLTGSLTTRPAPELPGRNDHKRDMDFLAVQASAVAEEPVLAQLFTVIRRDDDQGVLEQAAALEFVHQLANLGVKIADAVVVRVAHQGSPRSRARFASLAFPNPARAQDPPESRRGVRSADRSLRARYKESGRQSN